MGRQGQTAVDPTLPRAHMLGYSTDLRSMTQGRATYTMEPHSYNPVPHAVQVEILEALK